MGRLVGLRETRYDTKDRRKLTKKHKFLNKTKLGTHSKNGGDKINSQNMTNTDQKLIFEKVGRDHWREPPVTQKPEPEVMNRTGEHARSNILVDLAGHHLSMVF